jgi:superfamily II DNA helicase RecQ
MLRLLDIDHTGHHVLCANADSERVLAGEQKVLIRKPRESSPSLSLLLPPVPRRKSRDTLAPELLALLQEWRVETARKRALAPESILEQIALNEIARMRPRNYPDLAKVPGMNIPRLRAYGAPLLRIVSAYERLESASLGPPPARSSQLQAPAVGSR